MDTSHPFTRCYRDREQQSLETTTGGDCGYGKYGTTDEWTKLTIHRGEQGRCAASDEPTKKTQQQAKKRKTKNALLWTDHQRRFNKPKILNEPKIDGIIMDVSERTMRQQ